MSRTRGPYGTLAHENHFSEFGQPLIGGPTGTITAAVRKATAVTNLGITATAAELNLLSGLGATAAELNAAADVSVRLVSIPDATTYAVLVANSGKPHVFPDLTATCTAALPAEAAGLEYDFYYKGVAADAADWVFDSGANANFFLGGLLHCDTDAGPAGAETKIIAGNGTSNSKLTIKTPAEGTYVKLICDGTHWIVSGVAVSATVPAFADQ